MVTEPQPQDCDLVLGGQQPNPINGAVLGGLTGLNQRFEKDDLQQKLAALVEAARHKDGLSILHRGLEHENLLVRAEAYLQLKALETTSGQPSPIIERGIPLRVGDRLYGVYRSAITYGDDWYYIYADLDDLEFYYEDYPFYQSRKDAAGNKFEYIYDSSQDSYEYPSLVGYFLDETTARAKAEAVYLEAFARLNCSIYEISVDIEAEQLDLKAWVEENQIVVEKVPIDWQEEDLDWRYQIDVLTSLFNRKRYDLLREIWEPLGYDRLAFVYEHAIDRPCYLRIGELEK
jgi:hypothetical protein